MKIKVEEMNGENYIMIDITEEERENIKKGRFPTGTTTILDEHFTISIGNNP